MTTKIKVGPPVVTMNQGTMFMVTNESGEIWPDAELGFFGQDTRLISSYQFFVNRKPWQLATSASVNYYSARYHFISPTVRSHLGTVKAVDLGLTLERTIGDGVHEDFDIVNYANREVTFFFEIAVAADFADIFEVKRHEALDRGNIDSVWNPRSTELEWKYVNQDFKRGVVFQLCCVQTKPHFANGRVTFDITLKPREKWHTCSFLIPVIDGERRKPKYACYQSVRGQTEVDRLHEQWQKSTTGISTPNGDVNNAFQQSISDMGALRLYEHDVSEQEWLPAAGVPWFVTVFGRDSLIVSLQNMFVNCGFALGTLKRLAEFQATERDDWRDAQPGKILHEIRFGELAHFRLIPHVPYYGTADATILFLIVLSEAYRWMGEEKLLKHFRDVALRCLEWIDRYGDLDGDGFQEYKTFSKQGYHNMGWKDAEDAVVYPDGSQVQQPIAICELQGYVYDAKLRMAEVFEVLGEKDTARQLRTGAEELKRRFNEIFWSEQDGFYAYALNPDKGLVRTIASNPGHLLWSGIVDSEEKAERVISRLLQPDMFSGWGIRTLSSRNPAYNPHSYQRGSVWPHDNGIIAAGAKRYGLWQEANQIARVIFDVSGNVQGFRLPELFAGLEREPQGFPVQYIGANVPQAWAAGSIFMLLQTILGLSVDAPRGELYLWPTLPEWLPEITVSGLRVGRHRCSLRFFGTGLNSRWEVLDNDGSLQISGGQLRAA
jgi:glycogen debranching enzyme